jgi:hypothetical protein
VDSHAQTTTLQGLDKLHFGATITSDGEKTPMSEFEATLERKLLKNQDGTRFQRTIRIEDRTENDDYGFLVRIKDYEITGDGCGLRDPNKSDAPILNYTPGGSAFPQDTLEDAIDLAGKVFKRSVDHENLTPLAPGEDFPS